jgi:hypothetical protein
MAEATLWSILSALLTGKSGNGTKKCLPNSFSSGFPTSSFPMGFLISSLGVFYASFLRVFHLLFTDFDFSSNGFSTSYPRGFLISSQRVSTFFPREFPLFFQWIFHFLFAERIRLWQHLKCDWTVTDGIHTPIFKVERRH